MTPPDSSGAQPLGPWWHLTIGLGSLVASLLAWLAWRTNLVEDSWSALVQQLALWLALAGVGLASWLARNAVHRHQWAQTLLVGVPTLLGIVKPAMLFLGAMAQIIKVFLFAD